MKPHRRLLRFSAGVLAAGVFGGLVVYTAFPGHLLGVYRVWQRREAGFDRRSAHIGRWTIPYLDSAPGSEQPIIVLLHGFGDTKDNLVELAAGLTGDYRVVIPDLPGFGETAVRPLADYTPELYVDTVLGLLDQLDASSVHLAGYSMGGLLAVKIAERAAGRVETLTLLAPAGIRGDRLSPVDEMIQTGQGNPLVYRDRDSFERLLRLNFNQVPDIPDFAVRALSAHGRRRADIYERVFENVLTDDGTSILQQQVASLRVPILLVGGDADQLIDPSAFRQWQELLPSIELVMLPGGSHALVHQQAEAVQREIRRHLQDHRSAETARPLSDEQR